MTVRFLGTLVALAVCATAPFAQQRDRVANPVARPAGTAMVAGLVTEGDGGQTPVRRAIVTLKMADATETYAAVTDTQGRFAFANLPEGRYRLNARKPAYLSNNYGAKRPGRPGTALAVAAGQQLTDLRLPLPRGGVITGFLRSPTGEPVVDTQVVAIPMSQATAGGRYMGEQAFRTDDRGEYRIYGLSPDDYLVGALPSAGRGQIRQRSAAEYDEAVRTLEPQALRPGQAAAATQARVPADPPTVGFAPTYYPGTPVATDALAVTVKAGEVRDGIDIPVTMVRVATISGVVRGIGGQPIRAVQLSATALGPPLPIAAALSVQTSRPDEQGRFVISNVAPGTYTISARGGGITFSADGSSRTIRGDQQTEWAVAEVQVQGNDIEGLILQLQPGLTFSGRLAVASTHEPPDTWKGTRIGIQVPRGLPGVVLNGVSVAGTPQRAAAVNDDGSFEVSGLQPGNYEIVVTLPAALRPTWSVASITAGGRELRDAPLTFDQGSIAGVVVTLTDAPAGLTGTLSSASGQAASDYYVVLFPADRALWHPVSPRIRVMRPAVDGGFTADDLLPGAYRIAALTDVEDNEWRTAPFLESVYDASLAVTIAGGAMTRQDIRIR